MRLTSTHLAIALTLSLLAPAAAMAQEPILPDEVKDIPTEYAGALPVQGVPSVKLVEGDAQALPSPRPQVEPRRSRPPVASSPVMISSSPWRVQARK